MKRVMCFYQLFDEMIRQLLVLFIMIPLFFYVGEILQFLWPTEKNQSFQSMEYEIEVFREF